MCFESCVANIRAEDARERNNDEFVDKERKMKQLFSNQASGRYKGIRVGWWIYVLGLRNFQIQICNQKKKKEGKFVPNLVKHPLRQQH